MPKNFNLGGRNLKDPRVIMRVIIGTLLVANLAAAIVAFKPFGGSAEDLRMQQQSLQGQLSRAQANLQASKRLVDKVQTARRESDQFLAQYVVERRSMPSTIQNELNVLAEQAGIKAGPASYSFEEVEGSDTLFMLTISAGYEGSYAALTKFVNLLDRSKRFFIVENMNASAPQGQQGEKALNVTLKIDTFVRDEPGTGL